MAQKNPQNASMVQSLLSHRLDCFTQVKKTGDPIETPFHLSKDRVIVSKFRTGVEGILITDELVVNNKSLRIGMSIETGYISSRGFVSFDNEAEVGSLTIKNRRTDIVALDGYSRLMEIPFLNWSSTDWAFFLGYVDMWIRSHSGSGSRKAA